MTFAPLSPVFSQGFAPAPRAKHGMFGGRDIKSGIAAAIGGFLAGQNNPAGMAIIQGLQQNKLMKQRQEYDEQQYQRQRSDGMQDWVAKEQWQREHPSQQPSDFEQYAQAGGYVPGSPEWQKLMKQKADAMANPIVMTPYGPMPYSSVMQQPPEILRDLPSDAVPLGAGGPTPQASGGFLRF